MFTKIILENYNYYKINNNYCGDCINDVVPLCNDLFICHSILNFSKNSVPFINNIIIKPVYNENKNLIYLIGITSMNEKYSVNTDSISSCFIETLKELGCKPFPISTDFDGIIKELEYAPFPISLTTPSPPFIIKYVNKEWITLCRYKKEDAIGKTFSIIQGKSVENILKKNILNDKILYNLENIF